MKPPRGRFSSGALLAVMVMASTILVRAEQLTVPYPHIPPSVDKVTIRVYDSTFNQLADKIAPLTLQGHYTYSLTECVPFTSLCNTTTICSSDWTVTVSQLRFGIKPDGIRVTGKGDAAWCGVAGSFTVETSADATHTEMMRVLHARPGGVQRTDAVLVTLTPTSIQPVLTFRQYTVPLPVHINVAPALSFSIPLAPSLVSFETPAGPRQLRLSPNQISLVKRNGYMELQSNVSVW